MDDRIVTRHIGPYHAWQGPESEAPEALLPIDVPVCEGRETPPPSPIEAIRASDWIYFAIGVVGTWVGGMLSLWVMR